LVNYDSLYLFLRLDARAMTETKEQYRRVVIISANPLFREGLRKMYADRWSGKAAIVATPTSMDEAANALEKHQPDLVIVDYDDKNINRAEFLERFFNGASTMQVMLVSLNESGEVVVYDRRKLTPAQAQNWLNDPWQE
jgi:cytochrome c oxidase subunit 2